MIRNWTVAALAACMLLPAASEAQDAPRRPSTRTRPRVRVETRDGGGPFGVYAFGDNRGRIGVIVDTKADASADKVGARIDGITPGGPAEKAGLKVGDVITRFKGTALGGAASEDDERSGPGMRLIDLARELDPGDTVQVEYRRGNDARKVTLVAEDLGGGRSWSGQMEMPDMDAFKELLPQMRTGPGNEFEFAFGSPWGGIELVELNPDLGDYFGTREGVLVVKAPEDSTLALKGGDVIVSIGGRKPTSPMQAMRILRSYDPGESVTLDVLRKQRHVSVSWKVPEHEKGMLRRTPRMHEEPSRLRIRDVIRTSRAI
jgi:S1-C subfamily serine protease